MGACEVNCVTCHFFVKQSRLDGGWCHRYPPQIIATGNFQEGYGELSCETYFPNVGPTEWCGEYQKAAP